MNSREAIALVAWVALCLVAAAIGGWATATSVDTWYAELEKPSWNPPNAVFAPVWTTLYVVMGIAAWLVWRRPETADRRIALALFGAQLTLNTLWSALFFGLERPGLAAIEIVLLWLAIAATIRAFAPISRPAAWLLAPYLAWVTFATALNVAIWRLNA